MSQNNKPRTWTYERFTDDGRIFAVCPLCGFHYVPQYTFEDGNKVTIHACDYCGGCGANLSDEEGEADVIWKQRSLKELEEEMEQDESD